LLSSILSVKQQEIINECRAICYCNSKLLNLIFCMHVASSLWSHVNPCVNDVITVCEAR